MVSKSDNDNGHDNGPDNGKSGEIVPAPKANALASTSLTALTAVLAGVNTSSITGRSGFPMILFKSRTNDGTWMYGRKQIVPEAGSRWIANITSFQRGWVYFAGGDNKPEERMLPVSEPMPARPGPDWQQQWTVHLKCVDGADAGVQVEYKATNQGCLDTIGGLLNAIRERLMGGQHNGDVYPALELEHDSYMHPQYGRTGIPVLRIVDWMSAEGPQSVPAVPPPPPPPPAPPAANTNQPRRRRVA